MIEKTPGTSFLNELKDWVAKNSGQCVYVEIPPEGTDVSEDAPTLKAQESYFRVLLTDLSLDRSGGRMAGLSQALHASVKMKYGDRGVVNLNRVVSLPDEARIAGGFPGYHITELMPYVGGKVELAAGLLTLRPGNREVVATAVNFLSGVSGLNTEMLVKGSPAAELSAIIDRGVKELMKSAGGHIHLGLHHAFEAAQTLRPGYIAAVMAKPGRLNPERLAVREGRLFYRERPDSAPRPLEGFDYMLFRIEGREERGDWQIKSIQEPLNKAVRALLRGNRAEAWDYQIQALTTACESTDLTVADRRRLAVAINDEWASLEDTGRGAVGAEERDLSQIMAARAIPLELARNKPGITLTEVLMGDKFEIPLGGVPAGEIFESGAPEDEDKEAAVKEPAVPGAPQYRRFNAWVAERVGADDGKPLVVAETYTLKLNVGWPTVGSLITSADAVVTESEIPEEGLDTTWYLGSKNVELSVSPDDPNVKVEKNSSHDGWGAEFALHISKKLFSDTRELRITPTAVEDAEISIIILARGTLYRQFNVELKVVPATGEPTSGGDEGAVKIVSEAVHMPAKYTGLVPQHEWQTPPGVLSIIVQGGGRAFLLGDAIDPVTKSYGPVTTVTDWGGSLTDDAGLIRNLLEYADKFREEFSDELDDIEAQDLETRLSELKNNGGRFWDDALADQAHTQVWEKIARSDALHDLAFEGYGLFQTIFPPKSELRLLLEHLQPGWRVNINWLTLNDQARPAHIPWNLLYTQPPQKGQPIDPENFWGLRFRVNYLMQAIKEPRPPALGSPFETEAASGFYWGMEGADKEIAEEVTWQKGEWTKWGKQVYVPDSSVADAAKVQLVALLNGPSQTPIFYFFCNCTVGSGNKPVLRFGNSPDPEDNVKLSELGAGELAGQPMVFVNACTSGGSDPYVANELVRQFFRRSCRSYLGTEVKVPVRFASRFAKIFYSFFYRVIAPEPLAAGEAAYQARRFLWREYRNVGGLLYTYLNQYELYMATADELSKMHSHQ